jgi:hypothetical protein
VNRLPPLITAALICASVSSATAEPISPTPNWPLIDPTRNWTTYEVTITSMQRPAVTLDAGDGAELLKDPFTFIYYACMCGTGNGTDYFGTPLWGTVPMVDPADETFRDHSTGTLWLSAGEMFLDNNTAIARGRGRPFYTVVALTKPLDGAVFESTEEFRKFMETGDLDFVYRDVRFDEDGEPQTSQSFVYRGTARAVPEPSVLLSLLTGAAAFTLWRRRSINV